MKQGNTIQHGNNFDALDMHILINKISSVVLDLKRLKIQINISKQLKEA